MKIRIVDIRKADDAVINLYNVPFTPDFEKVSKALGTLGSTPQEVAKIVQLNRRTNQAYYFNFSGDGDILKKFFEQYYNHKSWEKIQSEYGSDRSHIVKEKESFGEIVKAYLATLGIKGLEVKYNVEEKQILFPGISNENSGALVKAISEDKLNKFFKKYGFEVSSFDGKQEPKRFLLKSI